jgi:hypothetical protein
MTDYCYGSSTDVAAVLAGGKKHLSKLEAWLEIQAEKMTEGDADKKTKFQVVHLVNGKFSAPDFHLYEMLDQFEALAGEHDLYADFKRIKEFKEGFAALE